MIGQWWLLWLHKSHTGALKDFGSKVGGFRYFCLSCWLGKFGKVKQLGWRYAYIDAVFLEQGASHRFTANFPTDAPRNKDFMPATLGMPIRMPSTFQQGWGWQIWQSCLLMVHCHIMAGLGLRLWTMLAEMGRHGHIVQRLSVRQSQAIILHVKGRTCNSSRMLVLQDQRLLIWQGLRMRHLGRQKHKKTPQNRHKTPQRHTKTGFIHLYCN